MPWNPDTYNKFKQERYMPFYDLLTLIKIRPSLSVLDLGCGTGELTRKLADALPGCVVMGIDASPEMLEASAQYARDGLSFRLQTIEDAVLAPEQYDLVFSNAAIQWVDNHQQLLPGIIARVKRGGQLAIQLPSNHHHFTHTHIRQLAATAPYAAALQGWNRVPPVLGIEAYAQILFEQGAEDINVFEKVYPHVLPDAKALVEWTSGTALVPYLERLPIDLQQQFKADYTRLLTAEVQQQPVFYPFKRTIISARL